MSNREAIRNALAFKAEQPTEKASTCARIYHVNETSVRTALHRQRKLNGAPVQNGGQNKILSESQIEAIYKFTEDMYLSGLGATKSMVFAAIVHLRQAEDPPKKEPSRRWFQAFLKGHPDLFQTIKTKPIAIDRVSAQDNDIVCDWFKNWTIYSKEKGLQAADILNFDETGFRIGVTRGEEIVVPAYVNKVYYLKLHYMYIVNK
jgi:hypothetical protein